MAFLVKHFIFIICFLKVQLNLSFNLFLYLQEPILILFWELQAPGDGRLLFVNLHFFILQFFSPEYFQFKGLV